MSHLRCVLALTLLLGIVVPSYGAQQPHLILIVADDLGWNDVSWHNEGVVSPNLGKLASEGMVLNRSYVQPICSPTRSALLASRYPFTIGRQGNVIWPLEPTGLTLNATILPQELKKMGYDTHAVGKWHLGFCKWEYTPTYRGFDSFYGYYTGSEDYYTHMRGYGYVQDSQEKKALGYDFRNDTSVNRTASGNYSAFLFSDRVDFLLRTRSPEKPLFLYIPFQSVHAPLQVPQNYSDIYKNISNHNRRTYLGMVSAMDDAVGRIVASLKRTGHYNNSVIVFTTDNGGPTISGSNNWPLRGNKTTLWEGGTRGSAFIHSPLLANPGTVSNRLIHVTDWYPTFVHLAGGPVPDNIDGVNQWEVLNNESLPDARDYFVYDIDEANGMRAAVRWGRYKLIVGDPGPSSWTPPPNLQKSRAPVDRKTGNTDTHSEEELFSDISESDGIFRAREEIRKIKEFVEKDSKEAILPDYSFKELKFSDRRKAFDAWEFDAVFSDKKLNFEGVNNNFRDASDEDSSENSIFPEKYELDDIETRLAQFSMKASKLDKPSREFINMALKYFEDNQIDLHRLLHSRDTDEFGTNGFDNFGRETDEIAESAPERGDKSSHRELKRRYRLATGASVRLTDFETVHDLMTSNVKMQLYDVEDDPAERRDLVKIRTPVVKLLLARLQQEQPRYCPPDFPPDDRKGDPKNFHDVWSPGWC